MSNPRFTRRDFQWLADWVAQLPRDQRDQVGPNLAKHLKTTNSNFNQDRFIEATQRNNA